MITKIQFPCQGSIRNDGDCGKLERIMSHAKRAAVVHFHPVVTYGNVGYLRYFRYFVKSPYLKILKCGASLGPVSVDRSAHGSTCLHPLYGISF